MSKEAHDSLTGNDTSSEESDGESSSDEDVSPDVSPKKPPPPIPKKNSASQVQLPEDDGPPPPVPKKNSSSQVELPEDDGPPPPIPKKNSSSQVELPKDDGPPPPIPAKRRPSSSQTKLEISDDDVTPVVSPAKPPPPIPRKKSNRAGRERVLSSGAATIIKQVTNAEPELPTTTSMPVLPVAQPPPLPKKSKTPGILGRKKLPLPPKDETSQRERDFTKQLLDTLKSFPAVPWDLEVRVNHLAQNAEDVMKNFCTTKNSMRMATRGYLEPMRAYANAAAKGQVYTLLDLTLGKLHKENKDVNYPKIRLNKCILDFGFKSSDDPNAPTGLTKNEIHKDSIIIKNTSSHTAQVSIQHFPSKTESSCYKMKIKPDNFTLKGNGKQTVSVSLEFLSASVKLQEILSVEIQGRGSIAEAMQQRSTIPMRLLTMVKANSELAVFGVSLSEVVFVKVGELQVPQVLVQLHEMLKQANGWNIVGIFRKAPAEDELQSAKLLLNKGEDISSFDPHVHATLIKIWFRDMPERLFSGMRTSTLQRAARSREKSIKLAADLPTQKRELLEWLCNTMTEVALKDKINKMGPANCGIVMGPNLAGIDQKDPMDAVMVMQSVNDIFKHLITARVEEQRKPK